MFLLFIKLIAGLALILLGANWLVDGSSAIARKFGISEFVVGLTIVGIGTSTPEMVVSFISSIQGNCDIAVGNVIGSNISNTFLILGLVAIVSPLYLTKENMRRDITFAIISSLLLFLFCSDKFLFGKAFNTLSRVEGGILLIGFILFMYVCFNKKGGEDDEQECGAPSKNMNTWMAVLLIAIGLCGLIFGGRLFTGSGSAIASTFGVSDAFIGITLMAVGTSLPELAASMVAAIKKRGQMALGNIIGSNISNIFLILGGASLIRPLTMNSITIVDLSLMLFTPFAILLCAYSFKKKCIDKIDGTIFFLIYVAYIAWLVYNI